MSQAKPRFSPAILLRGALVPILMIALWQALSTSGLINPVVLPSPVAVVERWWAYLLPTDPYDPAQSSWILWALSGEMLFDAWSSLYRVVLGFAVGAGLALPLGLAMGGNPRVYALFDPLMQVLRPIPPIAYIPLAILWFGLGNAPAIFLIAIGAFFPVLMNTIAGVRHVDGIYLRAARNLGAGRLTMFLRVILPAATPLHPGRRPDRHRHRLHRRDRVGDDRRQFRPRLPHPGSARVHVVGQDHRRDVHHRPAGAGHRPRHEPPEQPPAALAPRARELSATTNRTGRGWR